MITWNDGLSIDIKVLDNEHKKTVVINVDVFSKSSLIRLNSMQWYS